MMVFLQASGCNIELLLSLLSLLSLFIVRIQIRRHDHHDLRARRVPWGSQESVLVPWLRQLGETLVTGYPLIPYRFWPFWNRNPGLPWHSMALNFSTG